MREHSLYLIYTVLPRATHIVSTMAGGLLAHREGDRCFPWLWFVRAIGLVFTIITLGLTAAAVNSFGAIACDSPAKLNYNVAVVRFLTCSRPLLPPDL